MFLTSGGHRISEGFLKFLVDEIAHDGAPIKLVGRIGLAQPSTPRRSR
jgi:hypothetical protein